MPGGPNLLSPMALGDREKTGTSGRSWGAEGAQRVGAETEARVRHSRPLGRLRVGTLEKHWQSKEKERVSALPWAGCAKGCADPGRGEQTG